VGRGGSPGSARLAMLWLLDIPAGGPPLQAAACVPVRFLLSEPTPSRRAPALSSLCPSTVMAARSHTPVQHEQLAYESGEEDNSLWPLGMHTSSFALLMVGREGPRPKAVMASPTMQPNLSRLITAVGVTNKLAEHESGVGFPNPTT
jgi:hypothetical protein